MASILLRSCYPKGIDYIYYAPNIEAHVIDRPMLRVSLLQQPSRRIRHPEALNTSPIGVSGPDATRFPGGRATETTRMSGQDGLKATLIPKAGT